MKAEPSSAVSARSSKMPWSLSPAVCRQAKRFFERSLGKRPHYYLRGPEFALLTPDFWLLTPAVAAEPLQVFRGDHRLLSRRTKTELVLRAERAQGKGTFWYLQRSAQGVR